MAYRTVAIPMTLSNLQGHTPNEGVKNAIFLTVMQQLTRLQLYGTSRGPSAIAELVVKRR